MLVAISSVTYTDRLEAESDDISLTFGDREGKWISSWYPSQGDTLEVKIGPQGGKLLNCGLFEIDEVESELSPDTFTIKGIGAGITKAMRTRNSKAYEEQTIRALAESIAGKHGLSLTGKSSPTQSLKLERKTQDNQTDLAFLSQIGREYGLVVSVHGRSLVFMDVEELEAKPPVVTFVRSDLSNARFVDKTSQIYQSAHVAGRNVQDDEIYFGGMGGDGVTGDTLVIIDRVESADHAQARAREIKSQNRDKITGTLSISGNTEIVSGVNIELAGVGIFSGKWHVTSSTHKVDESGYITEVNVYKIR